MMKKLLREPLVHFLLLGTAIFVIYGLVTRHSSSKPGEIVVTQGKVENLITGFTRTWQRPPTEEELQGLIRDYVREEVAYREALAMGLDQDDTIIRRRLRQKWEFLSDNLATQVQPTDAELQGFLQAHPDKFKTETTFTFRHVYLNPQIHGANLARDATRLLAQLQHADSADIKAIGEPFILEHHFENIPLSEIKTTFGEQFASGLATLKTGQWQGPVQSGFGSHLVFVSERTEVHLPALAEIRTEVQREWANEKRFESEEKLYNALLKQYTVRIEPPEEKKIGQVHR